MDTVELNRAQYNAKEHRNDCSTSSRYDFLSPIVEVDGEWFHEVTVKDKLTGKVHHHSFETDHDVIDDIFAHWRAQLGASCRPLDVGVNR